MQMNDIQYDDKPYNVIDNLIATLTQARIKDSEQNKLIISLQDENQRQCAEIIALEEENCWLHRVDYNELQTLIDMCAKEMADIEQKMPTETTNAAGVFIRCNYQNRITALGSIKSKLEDMQGGQR